MMPAKKRGIVPTGPPWWTHQGGWDRFASSYLEQVMALQKIYKKLKALREWRRFRQVEFYKSLAKNNQTHKHKADEIKTMIAEVTRKQAQLKAQLNGVEAAIKRGAFALSAEEWENLRAEAREQIWKGKRRNDGDGSAEEEAGGAGTSAEIDSTTMEEGRVSRDEPADS